ncbi:unnamed protein product [Rotaria sordida]|uniref:Gfo/Idh/MocA-like oxidoreductase N-terminal domain-containing protein n=1 Tax=Rotaria sordida TaxID=392033 RepID=A0A819QMZ3_9BILA|nr:unnamed protein product [Rotaria sordida]
MKHYITSLPRLNLIPALPKNPRNYPIILIGAGGIVTLGHLPAYKIAGFSVKGIYDIDQQKAFDVAKKWHIPKVYNTINEACTTSTNENIIFDLAVPANQIQSVLKQLPVNSHALIQKPMGENLIDAQSIVNICKQRHIHGSINFQLRYAPYILALKDAIRLGWLGQRLTTVEIHVNVDTPWTSWPFLATVKHLEPTYHSIHYVDLIRDLLKPYEPTALHCRTSQHIMMPHLTSVRSSYSFEYTHDPMLYVNIYTNHHHRWGTKHAQSYILVEGTGGAAKAQIGSNFAYGKNTEGQQTDYLQICSDEITKGEWIDIDLQGRRNLPHAFIGSMAAAIRRYENVHDQPSTDIEDALKTMIIIETARKIDQKSDTIVTAFAHNDSDNSSFKSTRNLVAKSLTARTTVCQLGVAYFIQNPINYEIHTEGIQLPEVHIYGLGLDVDNDAPNVASRSHQYDPAGVMFDYADVSHDETIDKLEFRIFVSSV